MASNSQVCGGKPISIFTTPLVILLLQGFIYSPEGNAIAQEPLKVISQTNKKIAEELLRKNFTWGNERAGADGKSAGKSYN